MAGPRGLKRKAVGRGCAPHAAKKAAVATSPGNGTSSLGAQHKTSASDADATSETTSASSNSSAALQEGHMAISASERMAKQSAAFAKEEDTVNVNSADHEITAPISHSEDPAEKTDIEATSTKDAKLPLQPDGNGSTPATHPLQTVQTAAQQVLNLPELLEPILLSVPCRELDGGRHYWTDLNTILLAQRVNKTWRLTVQTSTPLKKALWLEHDEEAYIDMPDGMSWNPIIWPMPSRLGHVTPAKEWTQSGSCCEQSWSKMIMAKCSERDPWIEISHPSSSHRICDRLGDCRVGSWVDRMMHELPYICEGKCAVFELYEVGYRW